MNKAKKVLVFSEGMGFPIYHTQLEVKAMRYQADKPAYHISAKSEYKYLIIEGLYKWMENEQQNTSNEL